MTETRLIDANKLLKQRFNMYTGFQGTVPVVAVRDIENAPTIDTENLRAIGRWIPLGQIVRSPLVKNYKCSECEHQEHCGTHYCSNCGAKMEV